MQGARVDINVLHSNACGGDPQAVDELFEVLSSRFRLFAHQKIRNRVDAEEVVQNALMTVYREYNRMTFTTSFSAWACKVLDNRILGYFRTRKRESMRLDPQVSQNLESLKTGAVTDPGVKRKLLSCLRRLCRRNIRYARVLLLHYQGYKTKEICSRMNMKPETFYSALSKARAMLEDCLESPEVRQ